ncbi:hypothetical protein Q8F55_001574 [Vanrija albida]|uniref:Major facilitator superfamily (MFS) profile domain-containing protein n=1 Tax=Vanrija albida TaxID=181172 RepID=A0ABR3QHD5_9TREE
MTSSTLKDDLTVPGTTVILDEQAEASGTNNFTLVPTPSDDPADPLNWTTGRKWLCCACMVLYVMAVCFNAGCLYPIYGPLSEKTGISLAQINTGVGYFYLIEAVCALFVLPLTIAIGKRPVFIVSCACAAIFPFTLSQVTSNAQWVGLCVANGFFLSPLFVAPEAVLSDVFFYHERAFPFGIYIATTYGGALLAPVLSGWIYTGMGINGPPYLTGGFCILVAIFLFVFLEESNFDRVAPDHGTPVEVLTTDGLAPAKSPFVFNDKDMTTTTVVPAPDGNTPPAAKSPGSFSLKDTKDTHTTTAVVAAPSLTPDETPATSNRDHLTDGPGIDRRGSVVHKGAHAYGRVTSPWPGPRPFKIFRISPYAGGILWRGVFQPLAFLRLPIVLWCGLMFGIYQIFYNCMAALSSGVLGEPPYNMGPNFVGLTFLSPLCAIIPGAIVAGFVSDRFTISQARKRGGVSEAEDKLKLYIVPMILTPFGILMMGLGPYYEAHWMVFVMGEFVLTIAGPIATLLSITYAFDAFHGIHPREQVGPRAQVQQSAPYLLSLILVGMIFTFAFNYAVTPWAFDWGFRNWAISAVFIGTAINSTAFIMLRYGKRLRKSGVKYYEKIINI